MEGSLPSTFGGNFLRQPEIGFLKVFSDHDLSVTMAASASNLLSFAIAQKGQLKARIAAIQKKREQKTPARLRPTLRGLENAIREFDSITLDDADDDADLDDGEAREGPLRQSQQQPVKKKSNGPTIDQVVKHAAGDIGDAKENGDHDQQQPVPHIQEEEKEMGDESGEETAEEQQRTNNDGNVKASETEQSGKMETDDEKGLQPASPSLSPIHHPRQLRSQKSASRTPRPAAIRAAIPTSVTPKAAAPVHVTPKQRAPHTPAAHHASATKTGRPHGAAVPVINQKMLTPIRAAVPETGKIQLTPARGLPRQAVPVQAVQHKNDDVEQKLKKVEARNALAIDRAKTMTLEKAERAKREREERAKKVAEKREEQQALEKAKLEERERKERELSRIRELQRLECLKLRSPSRAVLGPGNSPHRLALARHMQADADGARLPTRKLFGEPKEKAKTAQQTASTAALKKADVAMMMGMAPVKPPRKKFATGTDRDTDDSDVVPPSPEVQLKHKQPYAIVRQLEINQAKEVEQQKLRDEEARKREQLQKEEAQRRERERAEKEAEETAEAKKRQQQLQLPQGGPSKPVNKHLLNVSQEEQAPATPGNDSNAYDTTFNREEAPSTDTDYNIADLASGDETDDEEHPRKRIPDWAKGEELRKALRRQNSQKWDLDDMWGPMRPPDLEKIFGPTKAARAARGRSAEWGSPIDKPTEGRSRFFDGSPVVQQQ